jgi:hypothetical protein
MAALLWMQADLQGRIVHHSMPEDAHLIGQRDILAYLLGKYCIMN